MLLKRTKEIFAKRRELRAEQENERQARITAKLQGERLTEEAEQKAKLEKAVAVVGAEKKVELAQQEKEKVLVERSRELEVATMERKIQKEKVQAAKLAGQATEYKGFAEAKVAAAMYKALNNPIYLAEIKRDMALGVSENMKGIKVVMPSMMIGGSNGASTNNISTINDLLSAQLAVQLNPKLADTVPARKNVASN